jgi:hypothetical protein
MVNAESGGTNTQLAARSTSPEPIDANVSIVGLDARWVVVDILEVIDKPCGGRKRLCRARAARNTAEQPHTRI